MAQNSNVLAPLHTCYKNWDENVPSTLMESQAILEGFQQSVETHGLLYKYTVMDGDINVHKTMQDSNVYDNYNLIVVRIRCYNHLLRNLSNKLSEISRSTQPNGTQHIKNFVTLTDMVNEKSKLIRKLIKKSVEYWRSQDLDFKEQQTGLQQDIDAMSSRFWRTQKL